MTIFSYRSVRCMWLLFITSLGLFGCASGPPFQPAASVPSDKAVIYVYRPPVMHGAVFSPEVTVGGNAPVALSNGGYFTTFVLPGDVLVSISNVGKRSLTISAVAGNRYYVKGGTVTMAGGYPALSVELPVTALPEIKECKLIDSRQP